MQSECNYFGIDIGTATSCCFQWSNNEATSSYSFNPLTPSVVLLAKNISVGDKAISRYHLDKQCLLYNVKRIIGRDLAEIPQCDKDHFPYKLDVREDRTAIILPEGNMAGREYIFPEEVYTEIVRSILPPSFSQLKGKKYVVVTVPEKFNAKQRAATIHSVECLGFDKVRLFSEPCAAAFSYFHMGHIKKSQTFVVFDFGGSTLDIAVIHFADNNFKVLAVGGHPYLGGIDIDNAIIDLIKKKFMITQKISPVVEWMLKRKSENIKMELAHNQKIIIKSKDLFEDYPLEVTEITISRTELEEVINPILTFAVEMAYQEISKTAEFKRGEISMVLLAGGTSKIETLKTMVKQKFPNCEVSVIDQMSVARGACLQAHWEFCVTANDRSRVDLLMQPVGIRTTDGITEVLPSTTKIGEEVTVPFKFYPSVDYARELLISLFQGDWERFEGQSNIGTIKITIPHPDKIDNVCITLILSYNKDCLICFRALLNNQEIYCTMIHDRWHNSNPYYESQNREVMNRLISDIRTHANYSPEGEQVIQELIVLQDRRSNNQLSEVEYIDGLRLLDHRVTNYLSTSVIV